MIRQTEIERYLDDWLGNAPMAPADRLVVAVAVRIGREKQRPAPRIAWALADLRGSTRLLTGIAAVLAISILAYAALRLGGPPIGTERSIAPPTEAPTASSAPSPTDRRADIEISLVGGLPKGWNVTASGLLSFRTAVEPGMSIELFTNPSVGAENCDMGPEPGVDTSADAFVDAIVDRRGVDSSAVLPVAFDDLEGVQVDVALDAAVGPTCGTESRYVPLFGLFRDAFWNHVGVAGTERMRLIVLDVPDGETIVILVVAPDGSSFERYLTDAMAIVSHLSIAIE